MQTISVGANQRGFSLPELTVAMAIFLVVSAVGFALFNQQQVTFSQQLGEVGLNISVRNTMGMIQTDVANAGNGVFGGANIPAWPVGITFVIPPAGTCYDAAAHTYGPACFGQLNIIASDPNTPPANLTDNTGANSNAACSRTDNGVAYAQGGANPNQVAGRYGAGDQLLFLSSDGHKLSTAVLTAAPTVVGTAVKFAFSATDANGQNTAANDPLQISTQPVTSSVVNDTWSDTTAFSDQLSNQFCGADWVVKLSPIVYQVDSTDLTNPKLTRTQAGIASVVMEQVTGFRIGATVWNDGTGGANTTYTPYYYDPATFPNHPNDFSLVRSIRISLIARTAPNNNPTYHFRNSFDNGPYQIQGGAVVINPRNLSMND
jgi:prepilin-type N-terminal cleavage/methylation domain-containing protein